MSALKLEAGAAFPAISVPRIGGGSLELGTPADGYDWKLVVVYRGKHCPICTRYLQTLNQALPELNALGIDVVAVSADSESRTVEQLGQINPQYPVGYDLGIAQMQALGLYISGPRSGLNVERPFAEPGLFVINEAGNVQMIDISNVPFARPSLDSLVGGLRFVRGLTEPFPVNGTFA